MTRTIQTMTMKRQRVTRGARICVVQDTVHLIRAPGRWRCVAGCLAVSASLSVTARAQDTTRNAPPGAGQGVDLGTLLRHVDPGSVTMNPNNVTFTNAHGDTLKPGNPLFDNLMKALGAGKVKVAPSSGGDEGQGPPAPQYRSIFDHMSRITLTPVKATLSAKRDSVALHLVNTSNDEVPLDFAVQPVLTPNARGRSGPSEMTRSLSDWVRGVPTGVVLGPGESRTVVLHVAAPANATPGTYAAQVVVYYKPTIAIDQATDLSGDVVAKFFADTTARGFPRQAKVVTQLRYTVPGRTR